MILPLPNDPRVIELAAFVRLFSQLFDNRDDFNAAIEVQAERLRLSFDGPEGLRLALAVNAAKRELPTKLSEIPAIVERARAAQRRVH